MITPETLPTRYEAGTASVTAGQTTVTQTDAAWFGNVWGDDLFFLPSQPLVPPQRVAQANEDGTLTLAYPWPGASAANVGYEVRYVGMIERSTAQSRRVLEQLGEVDAYYDVQVNTLADRAAFDSKGAGYRVLVSDTGDGRAAIYMRTGATATWTAPAYISGPVGPRGPIGVPGVNWQGIWSSASTYALRDGVLYAGSSWRSKQDDNTNHAPPTLPTVENAWWHLVAQRGADGTGTGDVVGPNGGVGDGEVLVSSGTTGKALKGTGKTLSDLVPSLPNGTILGRQSAGAGPGEALTPAQARKLIAVPVGAFRNLLINPVFDQNQRAVSGTVALAAGSFGHDRMKAGAGGCTYTFSTSNGVTTINISAGSLVQVIEAAALAGRPGEHVLTWNGTAPARINGGAYGASSAVKAVLDGSANVTVEWGIGTLSLPQLELGYATEFSGRHPAIEAELTMRYHETLPGGMYGPNSVTSYVNWFFQVRKRATPTFGGSFYAGSSIQFIDNKRIQFLNQNNNAGVTDGAATAEL